MFQPLPSTRGSLRFALLLLFGCPEPVPPDVESDAIADCVLGQGWDADCDGVAAADDCDDSDPASTVLATDGDCDGIVASDDCDDSDPTSPAVVDDRDGRTIELIEAPPSLARSRSSSVQVVAADGGSVTYADLRIA